MLKINRLGLPQYVGFRNIFIRGNTIYVSRLYGNAAITTQSWNTLPNWQKRTLGPTKISLQCHQVRKLVVSNHYVLFNKSDTDKNEDQKSEPEKPKESLFKRIQFVGQVFMNGCKNLYSDVKLALIVRRKLGVIRHKDYSKLTRDELHHMYETKADVIKTVPVVLLFFLPIIGYFVPLIAFFYPRKLLSQQFWHPDQKKAFILEEYEQRSQYYLPLIKECAKTCKEIKSKHLYHLCMQTITGAHPTNDVLLRFKDEFSLRQDFSLHNVPRYHLVKLCKCWLIPTGWYLPRWYLTRQLRRRISRLHLDDKMIMREGVTRMSCKSIAQALHVRGIDEKSLNLSSMIQLLEEWVQLSSHVTSHDVSFLAHCAAFKGANFEKINKDHLPTKVDTPDTSM